MPNTNSTRAASGTDREIDIKEYLGVLADHWYWLVFFAVAGLLVAAYQAYGKAPVYRASSLMQVESPTNMAPQALNPATAGVSTGTGRATAESAILKSRSVIKKAVAAEHLEVRVSPIYFPLVGEQIARFRSGSASGVWSPPLVGRQYAWGNESIDLTRIGLPDDVDTAGFRLTVLDASHYEIQHGQTKITGTVGQTLTGDFPRLGQVRFFVQSMNALPGTVFNVASVSKESAIASLQNRISIDEQPSGSGLLVLKLIAGSPAQAEKQLNAVMRAYLEQNVERQSQEAKQRLQFLKKQLPEIRQERDRAQAKLATYQTRTGTLDLSAQANAILSQLTNLDSQLAELDIQRQQLSQEYTQRAPQVKAVNEKYNAIQARRNKLQGKLKELPSNESKFLELRRNVQVKDQLYTQMLNTSQGLQVSKAGITGVTHIIDDAYAPSGRVAPNRTTRMLFGLMLGLLLGVLVVLAKTLLKSTLDNPDVIEQQFGVPVYATVPFSAQEQEAKKKGASLLALNNPEDPAIESLRSLRTSLQFALIDDASKTVAITGPTPGCGKSFVSANVAALIANSGSRVLLVDGDLRRGKLYRTLGVKQSPGLSEVLAHEAELSACLQPTTIDGLDVLTTGRRPPNPAELLLSPNFGEFKRAAEDQYDYVIFDLPPVLNVTDANLIAAQVAATFLVVRSELSTQHEVTQAIQRLERDQIKTTGVVFNGLQYQRLKYGYRRYNYYSYRYS
mgnify:CR=1 FL=1